MSRLSHLKRAAASANAEIDELAPGPTRLSQSYMCGAGELADEAIADLGLADRLKIDETMPVLFLKGLFVGSP